MSNQHPLRYKISSWRQLPGCKSNNSKHLRINISDYFNNDAIRGFRISVDHLMYGTLFATVLEARGKIVTEEDEYGRSELSVEAILGELRKYGFFITYVPNEGLGSDQLEYLMTLDKLGYDKIRIIYVHSIPAEASPTRVVAFQSSVHGDWLNNAYSPSKDEFLSALDAGTAINLTDISKTRKFRWDWLKDFVGHIPDIIQDNADERIRFEDPNHVYD